MDYKYCNDLKDAKYALVGIDVLEIQTIDVANDDVVATSLFTGKTVSYSIKHSGLIPLTNEEKNSLVGIYERGGERSLYCHIFTLSHHEYECEITSWKKEFNIP